MRTMTRPGTLGALAICTSASLWGLDGVILTPRLVELGVPLVVFLIHAVPFVGMQPFLRGTYPSLTRLRGADLLFLVLVAVTGGLVGTFAIVKALFLVNFQQLTVVVLLQKLQPLFAIALAGVLLGERLSRRFLLLAALALFCSYLMTFGLVLPNLDTGGHTVAAALWAAVAAAAFGFSTVLGKRVLATLDFKQATFARYGLTALLALVFLVVAEGGIPLGRVTADHWKIVLLIATTTGSGAIFLYYFGLQRVRAIVAAVCELCLPLTAILLDYFINDSALGPWQWTGAIGLLGAIALVTAERATRAQHTE